MTDANPVYQRIARITRTSPSTNHHYGYTGSSSRGISCSLLISLPVCHSEQDVRRDGRNKRRKIQHLSIFGRKNYLLVPAIRLVCRGCRISFVWMYDFVGPKQQYSWAFRAQTVEQALGSTAAHSARMQEAPVSTVQRMHQNALPEKRKHLAEQYGRKLGTRQAWYWVSTTLPSKRGTRTILLFIIFAGKPCWIC
nr:transposase family protein [Paenibacillus taihuensis]